MDKKREGGSDEGGVLVEFRIKYTISIILNEVINDGNGGGGPRGGLCGGGGLG